MFFVPFRGFRGPSADLLDVHRTIWYDCGQMKHKTPPKLTKEDKPMSEIQTSCVYFSKAGRRNTARTLELARARAEALGIRQIVVATTGGDTGVLAAQAFLTPEARSAGTKVIAVTHSTGFKAPDTQELSGENKAAIEAAGAQVLTCQHAFGGVGRAVRKKLGTYELEEIVAYTLRTFGEGMKVVAEMALMVADAGLVRTDEPVLAIAGTGLGADTAVILKAANAQDFFDLRFLEIICMPAPGHP
jgi:hypothetical protein